MNRLAIDSSITQALAALLHATYTEDVPTEAECDAMRGHVTTLNDCIKQYQRRVDELERPAAPDPEAVERVARRLCFLLEESVACVDVDAFEAQWNDDEFAVNRLQWVGLARILLAAGLDPRRLETKP